MRKKSMVKSVVFTVLVGCIITGCQSQKNTTVIKEKSTTQATTEAKEEKTYSAGEAVNVQGEHTKLEFTITDYGSFYDDEDNAMIYIKYHAKNIGKNTEVVGQSDFTIYADDYGVSNTTMIDTPYGSTSDNVELASGKMANGIFFAKVDTEEVARLEVKVCDQKTYVLQHRKVSSVQKNYNNVTTMEDSNSSNEDNTYILPNSDSEYIGSADIDSLSEEEKRLAINEIYARHGRKFNKKDIREYFESKNWYNGTIEPKDFDEGVLNKYEKANIKTLVDSE